jgi:ribosomal protein S6
MLWLMEPRIRKNRSYDFLCMLRAAEAENTLPGIKIAIERAGGELPAEGVGANADISEGNISRRWSKATEDADHGRLPIVQTRRLAYPIGRETNALMAAFEFQGSPELPERLKEALRHNPHILRYMLTRKVKRPRKQTKPKTPALRTLPESSSSSPAPVGRGSPDKTVPFLSELRSSSAQPETDTRPAETVREPEPQLSSEDIDKKIEEIIG